MRGEQINGLILQTRVRNYTPRQIVLIIDFIVIGHGNKKDAYLRKEAGFTENDSVNGRIDLHLTY